MKQTAKVTTVNGNKATVEVGRTSACSGCAQNASCFACKKMVSTVAQNDIGAKTGDTVTVESSSARILGYTAAVFVLPLAAGLFCFYIMSALFPDQGALIYIIPTLIFALLFAAVCIVLDRRVKKDPDVTITEIIQNEENKNDREVENTDEK